MGCNREDPFVRLERCKVRLKLLDCSSNRIEIVLDPVRVIVDRAGVIVDRAGVIVDRAGVIALFARSTLGGNRLLFSFRLR